MKCSSCQLMRIQGLICHEIGCPYMGARYDKESKIWIKQRKCFDCGYTVDINDPCCRGEIC